MADAYLLKHRAGDADEDYRLNRQFVISKKEVYQGHSLHPTIIARLPSLHSVADLGCGTGVWLRDVSRTFFSNRSIDLQPTLAGWDVNPTDSDGQNSLHAGLQIFRHDCTQPIDSKWYGKFDVVNMGAMAYAIREDGWSGLLDNVFKLLKPGGFLQWRDTENKNFIPINGPPEIWRALDLWSEERVVRGLVTDMPRYMISAIMFAKNSAGTGHCYQVEDFHLDCTNTAESLSRDNVKRHLGSDDLVLLAAKAILQGRLLRLRKDDLAHPEETSAAQHIQELEQLGVFLEKAIQEQKISFKCAFPHLIARKL